MCAAACLLLGVMHLLFWFSRRLIYAHLLAALMSFSAAASAMLELAMLKSKSIESYSQLLCWENLAIYLILVPMVWFVDLYLQSGRRWLAITITLLWSIGILINFLLPGNLTFIHVAELQQQTAFWGEEFAIPVGIANPWKLLVDIASLLILLYTLDATLQLWRRRRSRRAWVVGGAIAIFILSAGIHSPLVDAGVVNTPYMVSFFFLAIVFALSYQVVADAGKAVEYQQELLHTRRELDRVTRINMLGEFSAMLAHELNQPLAAILSNAQAGRRYLVADGAAGQLDDILSDIIRDDKRASGIISHLRGMLRHEKVASEHLDLNAVIAEVVEILRGEFRERQIRLSFIAAPDLPSICAGRIELQQVVLNLLLNAAREVAGLPEAQREVSIHTDIIEQSVHVVVKDSGPGIPAELKDSLFDSFVTTSDSGLGMGLAICRRIIEGHGGRIWAADAPRGGAIFTFTLPLQHEN